jgi:HK97 family phage major capsid protein
MAELHRTMKLSEIKQVYLAGDDIDVSLKATVYDDSIVYEGYLLRYDSQRDLSGTRFTKATETGLYAGKRIPALFDHGQTEIRGTIGEIEVVGSDEVGWFVRAVVDRANKYMAALHELAMEGKIRLGLSGGALSHAVDAHENVETGVWEYTRFIIGEGSITPTPMEPNTMLSFGKFGNVGVIKGADTQITQVAEDTGDILSGDDTAQNTMSDVIETEIVMEPKETISAEVGTPTPVTAEEVREIVAESMRSFLPNVQPPQPVAAANVKRVTERGYTNEPLHAMKHWVASGDGEALYQTGAAERHSVLAASVGGGLAIKAALQIGVDASGGYAEIPVLFPSIIEKRGRTSVVDQSAMMRQSADALSIDILVEASTTAGMPTSPEVGPLDDITPTIGRVPLSLVRRSGKIMKTVEFEEWALIEFDNFLSGHVARKMAATENAALLAALTNATHGFAVSEDYFASASAITAAEVRSASDVLDVGTDDYGEGAVYTMLRSTWNVIRGLQGEGFLFGETSREGKYIDEWPVYILPGMEAIGASKDSVALWNPEFVHWGEGRNIVFKRHYAGDGISHLEYFFWNAGMVTQRDAGKFLQHA